MSPNGIVNVSAIADTTIQYLTQKGTFEGNDAGEIENNTITITTEMIESVVGLGALDCPHKGRLCGGCVIL